MFVESRRDGMISGPAKAAVTINQGNMALNALAPVKALNVWVVALASRKLPSGPTHIG
jgi:hypothetical protein